MKRWIGLFVLGAFLFPLGGLAANLVIRSDGPTTELALFGEAFFHSTSAAVSDARLIEVPGSALLLALWTEQSPGGSAVPHYAFSFDGHTFAFARETSYEIKLGPTAFDPLAAVPGVPASLRADPSGQLFIVQFVTQPLEDFHQEIARLGGTVYGYLPENAHIVKMDERLKALLTTSQVERHAARQAAASADKTPTPQKEKTPVADKGTPPPTPGTTPAAEKPAEPAKPAPAPETKPVSPDKPAPSETPPTPDRG